LVNLGLTARTANQMIDFKQEGGVINYSYSMPQIHQLLPKVPTHPLALGINS